MADNEAELSYKWKTTDWGQPTTSRSGAQLVSIALQSLNGDSVSMVFELNMCSDTGTVTKYTIVHAGKAIANLWSTVGQIWHVVCRKVLPPGGLDLNHH